MSPSVEECTKFCDNAFVTNPKFLIETRGKALGQIRKSTLWYEDD